MKRSGFTEIKHTADFSIYVWADDLDILFLESARGMFALMGLESIDSYPQHEFDFEIEGMDMESLLVGFLDELLFYLETYSFYPQEYSFDFSEEMLRVKMKGNEALLPVKEIKAVTYHNLEIEQDEKGLNVTIVFDV